MPRPSQAKEKRKDLLPIIAAAFTELGYRRATTAELAKRCKVQENILYRLWNSKNAMFLAAIDYVFELSAGTWRSIIDEGDSRSSAAEKILAYEATHHGEFGLYRIVFAGLSESDDPRIHSALRMMYNRFHGFIKEQIAAHGASRKTPGRKTSGRKTSGRNRTEELDRDLLAWAIVGLGTVASISREMRLLSAKKRGKLFESVGGLLLREGTR
jgi:AcrR family transcriptional regulator